MTINIRYRDSDHGPQSIRLPDPDRISVKPIRLPLEEAVSLAGQNAESRARLQKAFDKQVDADAVAETAANAAAELGGPIPSKQLQKSRAAVAEEVAEAKLEQRARAHAFVMARGKLIDAIDQHTPAWRDAALTAADRGVVRLATAREAAVQAAAELTEPLAVLEMLRVFPQTRQPVIVEGGTTASLVDIALTKLADAIGAAVEALEQYRGIDVAAAKAEQAKVEQATADEIASAAAEAIHAERAARRARRAEEESSDG